LNDTLQLELVKIQIIQLIRGKTTMHVIELPAEIDQNHQIHLQLPETIKARKAKVIVMYEDEAAQPAKPITFGLFKGKIQISDDFDEPIPDSFWLEGKL
jgi:hypothetical protein